MDTMLIGLIVGGVLVLLLLLVLLFRSKKEDEPKIANVPSPDIFKEAPANTVGEYGEAEAPKLFDEKGGATYTPVDLDDRIEPKIEESVQAATTPKPERKNEEVKTPEVTVPRPEVKPIAQEEDVGRYYTKVDPAIEAVVCFTPRERFFTVDRLVQIAMLVDQSDLADKIQVDFYNAQTQRWLGHFKGNESCTQVNMGLLLAKRGYCLDELVVARYIRLVDQISMELDGEVTILDSQEVVMRAQRIAALVAEFDNSLTMKVVSENDIDVDVLNDIALCNGFELIDGAYRRSDNASGTPILSMKIERNNTKEIFLTLDVAIANATVNWLGIFFGLANELSCKLDAQFCDESGKPVTSVIAGLVSREVQKLYETMKFRGIAAGSKRAIRLFSK